MKQKLAIDDDLTELFVRVAHAGTGRNPIVYEEMPVVTVVDLNSNRHSHREIFFAIDIGDKERILIGLETEENHGVFRKKNETHMKIYLVDLNGRLFGQEDTDAPIESLGEFVVWKINELNGQN